MDGVSKWLWGPRKLVGGEVYDSVTASSVWRVRVRIYVEYVVFQREIRFLMRMHLLLSPLHIFTGLWRESLFYGALSHFLHPANIRSDCVFRSVCEDPKLWVSGRYLMILAKQSQSVWVWTLPLALICSKILSKLFKLSVNLFSYLLSGNKNGINCLGCWN